MGSFERVRKRFQFTPLREGRQFGWGYDRIMKLFQFTPLREGRRGADGVHKAEAPQISIHAPA